LFGRFGPARLAAEACAGATMAWALALRNRF
jgi:hypothetical protein